jgi:CRISPR-associated protein Csd1
MILQALNGYYLRKINDPDVSQRLPAFGLEQKEIPFILEIAEDGSLVQLHDTRELVGKKKVAQSFRVPQGVKKTSGVAANLLWDTFEYVLGVDTRGNAKRTLEQHKAFCARIESLPARAQNDIGIAAVQKFIASFENGKLEAHPRWPEILETNPVVSFRLHGDSSLVCQRPEVINAILSIGSDADSPRATCLITGTFAPVQRIHSSIKGVWNAQKAGANIVSFNARAFESYGKTERQGENAPVSEAAAFAYTTALNHLLRTGSPQRIQVGDASTVFWAEQPTEFETGIPDLFGDPTTDNPDRGTRAVGVLYSAVQSGKLNGNEGDNRFHVLGLAPNAARISIRFHHCLRLRDLASNILAHFADLKVVRGAIDPEFPSLYRLLTSLALLGRADNIPPALGGAVMEAILSGPATPYPSTFLNAAVSRCRAEQSVSYYRAAIIKACLNRIHRRSANHDNCSNEKEFQIMLDITNANAAYRMGRLFATLEKIQEEASPGLNATIRDRYYGAASSTPVAVFTTLLRLKNAHLKKLAIGRSVWFERLLAEVLGPVSDFPKHLPLQDQGRFALGYYHQRQSFFTKIDNSSSTNPESQL